MEKLIRKIQEEAYIIDNRIVKVDHFINHMLDTKLVMDIGKEIAAHFQNATKILTIEASGIAFSVATAVHLNNIPIVFARKQASLITTDHVYKANVYSFTKQVEKTVIVDKEFLKPTDKIIIVDDFLATGNALVGLVEIAKQSGAEIIGCGIVIEKGFQDGRQRIESLGIPVFSLAKISKIENNTLEFER